MTPLNPAALPLDIETILQQINAFAEQLGGVPSAVGSGHVVEACWPLGYQTMPMIYLTQNGAQGHAPTIWPEGSFADLIVLFFSQGDKELAHLAYGSWRFPAGCTDTGGYGVAQYACQVIRDAAGIDDESLEWPDGSSAPVAFRAWPSRKEVPHV